MTKIYRIPTGQVEGNSSNETNTSEIRPYGEIGLFIGDNNKLELLMFDGVRTHRRSKILNKGTFYGGDADSSDGAGLDTIKLIPDANQHFNDGSYGNDQYLIVEPTGGEPGHVHIRAGGTIDSSTADLFLGGELNNVRVSDTSNSVTISADANNNGATRNWIFDTNGILSVPAINNENLFIQGAEIGSTTSGIGITATNGITLTTDALGTAKFWQFGTDGTLTFPNGSTYDNNTLTGAVDSDLEFVVKHRTTVSDVAAAGSTTGTLIVDISANDDITVVGDGWEINAGSAIAPIWMSVTETTIDPGNTYEIVVPEFVFEPGNTYTFRNPTPTSKVWTINSQNGTLIAPGNAILSSETQAIDNTFVTYNLSSPSRFNKVYWEAAEQPMLFFSVATDTADPLFIVAMQLKAELEAFGVAASRTISFTTLGGTTHSVTFPQYSNIQSQMSITELGSVPGISWLMQDWTWGVNGAPATDTIIDITSLSFSEAGTYRDFAIELPSQNGVDELRWDFNNNGTTVFPGSLEFGDGSVQSTAYPGITSVASGTGAWVAVGVSNMTRDALSVRVVAGMGSTLDVEINYSLPSASAIVMGSSTTVAFTQVLTKPLNIFGGQQTLTANNTTWTIINAETLSTIGDSVTAIISDNGSHKIYRVTVIARTLPDTGVTGDAYCTIEVLK